MHWFTLKQGWDLLEIYFHNPDNWSKTAGKYCTKFWRREESAARYRQVYCDSLWNWFHCWCANTWACSYSAFTRKYRTSSWDHHQLVIIFKNWILHSPVNVEFYEMISIWRLTKLNCLRVKAAWRSASF